MIKKGKVIVITGPTDSGKSALAIELAKRLETDIISADSRQIYNGIPIVTAVPSMQERDGITHHLMEILPLDAYYNASMFETDALKIVEKSLERNGYSVVCGGSMLYVDSFCYGIDDIPVVPDDVRKSLTEEWKEKGDDWLRSMLKNLDPEYWKKVDLKNLKRVFHAVEVSITSGAPYSNLLGKGKRERAFELIKICMAGERNCLFDKIGQRVENMVSAGLEEEARRLFDKRHLNSLNTVGLKEMFSYFEGEYDFKTAIEKIKRNTRVYAKKQETWYKKDKTLTRLDFSVKPCRNVENILKMLN